MVAVTESEQVYWYRFSRAEDPGRVCGPPFQLCDRPGDITGPAITSEYGWPPASSRPSASVSSPVSSRPLPLASSSFPLIWEICPARAPPDPLLTRTFQVPVTSWLPELGSDGLTEDDRCAASMLLRVSCTAAWPVGRPCDHCPAQQVCPRM
jgi:hypothetical protein